MNGCTSLTSVVSDPGLSGRPGVPGVVPVAGGQHRPAPDQHGGEHPLSVICSVGSSSAASSLHTLSSRSLRETRRPYDRPPAYIHARFSHARPRHAPPSSG
ncbi:hypothetical protein CDAR_96621 [Caerostris darwini]|uniref:Uncharacterized protein n=1 Tax=Caerostris darwini TaxID=1538125 RepID=A0AAV4QY43_9ARAC|nr:hypothetical protein CDAR_96621 [Caerostris darwini]